MNISEKRYDLIFNILLILIGSTFIFRKFNTICIVVFVVFNVFFYRKLDLHKKDWYLILIISSPLLLDILFIWNNDTILEGLKFLEKRISLLVFPIFIIGFHKKINIQYLASKVIPIVLLILFFLFLRYIIVFKDDFIKYLSGKDLWQLGYHFTNSFGNHAPALNLQLSFFTLLTLYCVFKNKAQKWLYITAYVLLLFFVLYINTRMAIMNTIICSFLILIRETSLKDSNRLHLIKRFLMFTVLISAILIIFIKIYPRLIYKFSEGSFSGLEKIGKIDEFEKPETKHGTLVLRLSIWKSTIELANKKKWIGYGTANAKKELIRYFKETNQNHLALYKFPVHNQYLDFFLKFGILGLICVCLYMFFILFLEIKLSNSLVISFFIIFFVSNLTDDFLIRFDGITLSGLWISIFANQYKFRSV